MVMISINVFRKKSSLYFVFCFIRWSKGNTFLFCCYRYIATTNIKITEIKSHLRPAADLLTAKFY